MDVKGRLFQISPDVYLGSRFSPHRENLPTFQNGSRHLKGPRPQAPGGPMFAGLPAIKEIAFLCRKIDHYFSKGEKFWREKTA